jgi:hypothetical protein
LDPGELVFLRHSDQFRELISTDIAPRWGDGHKNVAGLISNDIAPRSGGGHKNLARLISTDIAPLWGGGHKNLARLISNDIAPRWGGGHKNLARLISNDIAPLWGGGHKNLAGLTSGSADLPQRGKMLVETSHPKSFASHRDETRLAFSDAAGLKMSRPSARLLRTGRRSPNCSPSKIMSKGQALLAGDAGQFGGVLLGLEAAVAGVRESAWQFLDSGYSWYNALTICNITNS